MDVSKFDAAGSPQDVLAFAALLNVARQDVARGDECYLEVSASLGRSVSNVVRGIAR